MTEIKYHELPSELCSNYFKTLINRFYKILPLKEEMSETVDVYIMSLSSELEGGLRVLEDCDYDAIFLSLINTLEFLRMCDDLKICKREIFRCIKSIETLKNKYLERG